MLNDESAEKTPVVRQDFGQTVRRIDHGVGVDQVAENVIDLLSARPGQIWTNRGPFAEQHVTLRTCFARTRGVRRSHGRASGIGESSVVCNGRSRPIFVTAVSRFPKVHRCVSSSPASLNDRSCCKANADTSRRLTASFSMAASSASAKLRRVPKTPMASCRSAGSRVEYRPSNTSAVDWFVANRQVPGGHPDAESTIPRSIRAALTPVGRCPASTERGANRGDYWPVPALSSAVCLSLAIAFLSPKIVAKRTATERNVGLELEVT